MWLPDLERIDTVTRLEHFFSWGAILFVALMGVCEGIAHTLTGKKEALLSSPRRLSTRQQLALANALKASSKHVVGLCAPRVREAQHFAQSFNATFAEAGWSVKLTVVDAPEGELEAGVLFMSYEGNTPPSSPDFSALEKAFEEAQIPFKHVRMRLMDPFRDGVTTSDPVIMIGNRFPY